MTFLPAKNDFNLRVKFSGFHKNLRTLRKSVYSMNNNGSGFIATSIMTNDNSVVHGSRSNDGNLQNEVKQLNYLNSTKKTDVLEGLNQILTEKEEIIRIQTTKIDNLHNSLQKINKKFECAKLNFQQEKQKLALVKIESEKLKQAYSVVCQKWKQQGKEVQNTEEINNNIKKKSRQYKKSIVHQRKTIETMQAKIDTAKKSENEKKNQLQKELEQLHQLESQNADIKSTLRALQQNDFNINQMRYKINAQIELNQRNKESVSLLIKEKEKYEAQIADLEREVEHSKEVNKMLENMLDEQEQKVSEAKIIQKQVKKLNLQLKNAQKEYDNEKSENEQLNLRFQPNQQIAAEEMKAQQELQELRDFHNANMKRCKESSEQLQIDLIKYKAKLQMLQETNEKEKTTNLLLQSQIDHLRENYDQYQDQIRSELNQIAVIKQQINELEIVRKNTIESMK